MTSTSLIMTMRLIDRPRYKTLDVCAARAICSYDSVCHRRTDSDKRYFTVVKPRLSAMSMSKAVADRAITNQEIDRVVGERIRELRRARGLSLEIVAERCDVSIGFLSQIERGIS